jgi:Mrp family chromosome partitioning ATPase
MTGVRLVGRDREEDMVAGLLEGIRDRGGALVVAGEPGVGKSALLMAAAEMAADRGLPVAEAEGNPLALLELPAELSSSLRGGQAVLPRHLPLAADRARRRGGLVPAAADQRELRFSVPT